MRQAPTPGSRDTRAGGGAAPLPDPGGGRLPGQRTPPPRCCPPAPSTAVSLQPAVPFPAPGASCRENRRQRSPCKAARRVFSQEAAVKDSLT